MKEYELKVYAGTHPRILVTDEFVSINKFTLHRTQKEILKRICDSDGFFGFSKEIYFQYLTKANLVKFTKSESRNSDLEAQDPVVTNIYKATQDLLDYIVFAWSKALDQRGISATRSIEKIGCYLWLLGRDDLFELIHQDDLYTPYGAPALIAVCDSLGIEVPQELIDFSKNKCRE
jgi:hypothetical protein